MPKSKFKGYSLDVEASMVRHYNGLSESQKREYAYVESQKIGWGGIGYISRLLNVSYQTVRKGGKDVKNHLPSSGTGRQRKVGGGRKKKTPIDHLNALIDEIKAGSPTDPSVYWVHHKPREIADLYFERHGERISNGMVKRQLKVLNYKYRRLSKQLPTGIFKERNEQFHVIFMLVASLSIKSAVISIDCKKKEVLGLLHRGGKACCQSSLKVADHDYAHLATGKVIPHGIYDMHNNIGYVTVGTSHETAEFIAENILWWWDNYGIHHYPDAESILVLCDAGGGNGYRHHVFKQAMLNIAKTIGIDIIICHYPPYSSKWNPIEHRLFAHMHHAAQGIIFDSYQTVKMAFEKTYTNTGLKVVVRVVDKQFDIGRKIKKKDIEWDRVQFNKQLPKLSYRLLS